MHFHDRPHIRRSVQSLALSFLICSLIFMVPFIYFLEQNYDIFLQLAAETKPGLLGYLEREIVWLRMFLIFAGIATFFCISFISYRMFNYISTPFLLAEEHFESMEKHEVWSITPPRVYSEEMDQRFLAAYRKYHQYLTNTVQNDLDILKQINNSNLDRQSQFAIEQLKNRYNQRLGLSTKTQHESNSFYTNSTSSLDSRDSNGNKDVIEIFSKSSEVAPGRRVS